MKLNSNPKNKKKEQKTHKIKYEFCNIYEILVSIIKKAIYL